MSHLVSLILGICVISFTYLCQDSSRLLLTALPKEMEVNSNMPEAKIELQLVNSSSKELIIYGFTNYIGHVTRGWSIADTIVSYSTCDEGFGGLSVLLRRDNGSICVSYKSVTDDFDIEVVKGGPDSIQRRLDKYSYDIAEGERKIASSRAVIKSGDTLTTAIDISFQEYRLTKGNYNFTVTFGVYDELFNELISVRKEENTFIGCVESNSIKLIVK